MSWKLTSRIPEIVAAAEGLAADAVQKAGFDIEAGAKARARVDTGQMRDAIQWTPDPDDPLSGEVIAGAEHTIYNEYGTVTMPAQPMLTPAAEEVRPGFEFALARIYL